MVHRATFKVAIDVGRRGSERDNAGRFKQHLEPVSEVLNATEFLASTNSTVNLISTLADRVAALEVIIGIVIDKVNAIGDALQEKEDIEVRRESGTATDTLYLLFLVPLVIALLGWGVLHIFDNRANWFFARNYKFHHLNGVRRQIRDQARAEPRCFLARLFYGRRIFEILKDMVKRINATDVEKQLLTVTPLLRSPSPEQQKESTKNKRPQAQQPVKVVPL